MMLQMLGVFAEFEHATIVDRVTAGLERRVREGKWKSGRSPYGYARDKETKMLVPDPVKAPIVRRIFHLYAEGKLGTTAVARTLDAEAASPPRKQGWSPNALQLILANPAYRGLVRWTASFTPACTNHSLTTRRSRRRRRSFAAAAKTHRCAAATRPTSCSPASCAATIAAAPTSEPRRTAETAATPTTPAPLATSTAPPNAAATVTNQEADALVREAKAEIARLLGHPDAGGIGPTAGEPDAPAAARDEEQRVVAAQERALDEATMLALARAGTRASSARCAAASARASRWRAAGGCSSPIPESRAWPARRRSADAPSADSPAPAATPTPEPPPAGSAVHAGRPPVATSDEQALGASAEASAESPEL